MKKIICVFCASSNKIHPAYFPPARRLRELLAHHNYTLMYGGGKAGLRGTLVTAHHAHGGEVISVIPELFVRKGWCYEQAEPIILINSRRFFNPLLYIFKRLYKQGFVPQKLEDLFIVVKTAENALQQLQ
jgi:predicted Rossmann-fold nucleotide-binding protein